MTGLATIGADTASFVQTITSAPTLSSTRFGTGDISAAYTTNPTWFTTTGTGTGEFDWRQWQWQPNTTVPYISPYQPYTYPTTIQPQPWAQPTTIWPQPWIDPAELARRQQEAERVRREEGERARQMFEEFMRRQLEARVPSPPPIPHEATPEQPQAAKEVESAPPEKLTRHIDTDAVQKLRRVQESK